MKYPQRAAVPGRPPQIDILCERVGEAWRVHVWPTWLPDHLARCFDDQGEAFPVYIDLSELERQMKAHNAEFKRFEATDGSVEIEANGSAVDILISWLSRAFESGTQAVFG